MIISTLSWVDFSIMKRNQTQCGGSRLIAADMLTHTVLATCGFEQRFLYAGVLFCAMLCMHKGRPGHAMLIYSIVDS